MSPEPRGLFKDLVGVFTRQETQRVRRREMLAVSPPAFWSMALRWHEEVGNVQWTEDQRSFPSLSLACDPSFHLSASAPVHLTCPSLPRCPGSRRCRGCYTCADVASNPGQTDSPGQMDERWCEIKSFFFFSYCGRSGACQLSKLLSWHFQWDNMRLNVKRWC